MGIVKQLPQTSSVNYKMAVMMRDHEAADADLLDVRGDARTTMRLVPVRAGRL